MRWKIFGIFLCLLVAAGMGISCFGSREAKAVSDDPALSSEDIRNRIYDSIPLQEVEEILQDMKENTWIRCWQERENFPWRVWKVM